MGGVSEWYRSVIPQAPGSQQVHPNKAAAPARALGRAPHDHGALPLNRAMHPSFPPLCLDVPVYRAQNVSCTHQRGALAQPSGSPRHNLRGKIRQQKGAQPTWKEGTWRCLATTQHTANSNDRPASEKLFFSLIHAIPNGVSSSLGCDSVVPAGHVGTLNFDAETPACPDRPFR